MRGAQHEAGGVDGMTGGGLMKRAGINPVARRLF